MVRKCTGKVMEVDFNSLLKDYKMKRVIIIYGVYLIKQSTMDLLFQNENKELCKEFKRQNRKMGKLGIGIHETKYITL